MTSGQWVSAPRVRLLPFWLALAALVLALSACGGGDEQGEAGAGSGAAPVATSSGGGDSAGEPEEVDATVVMKDNLFEPDSFTFAVGSKVTFHYDNQGLAVHNMIVQSQEVEGQNFQSPVAVNPGESGEFEATFTKPGTFKFICVYHQPGMEGTITVQ